MNEHQHSPIATRSAACRAVSRFVILCAVLAACTSLKSASKQKADASGLSEFDGGAAGQNASAGASAAGTQSSASIGAIGSAGGAAIAASVGAFPGAGASAGISGMNAGASGASGASGAATSAANAGTGAGSGGTSGATGGMSVATGGTSPAAGGASSGTGGAPACVPSQEVCDGKDNDCDGVIDNGVKNLCGGCTTLAHMPDSACTAGSGDCQGTGAWKCQGTDAVVCNAVPVQPTAEICDGKDNNCNGIVDEGVTTQWYPDCDGDGYPGFGTGVAACSQPAAVGGCGWTSLAPGAGSTDCNDQLAVAHPGADFGLPIEYTGQSLPPANDTAYDLNCDGTLDYETTFSTGQVVLGQLQLVPFCDPNTACIGSLPLCITSWHFSGIPSCGGAYTAPSGCSGDITVYVLCK